jgi:hypothetical protein
MPTRLAVALVIAALPALPPAALAATRHGITPLAPKAGSSVPAGRSATFKMRVKGKGAVFVAVCRSKRKRADGRICDTESIGQARKKGSTFRYKANFYDYPQFWLNNPGTYHWQAYRIQCHAGNLSDCYQEGPVVRFKVAG